MAHFNLLKRSSNKVNPDTYIHNWLNSFFSNENIEKMREEKIYLSTEFRGLQDVDDYRYVHEVTAIYLTLFEIAWSKAVKRNIKLKASFLFARDDWTKNFTSMSLYNNSLLDSFKAGIDSITGFARLLFTLISTESLDSKQEQALVDIHAKKFHAFYNKTITELKSTKFN